MSGENAEAVHKHVRVYLVVFVALAVLTAVTVAASCLNASPRMTIAIALAIATLKASLVAGYFMHLLSERKTIYLVLGLTVFFFFSVLLLPAGQFVNPINGSEHAPTPAMTGHLGHQESSNH